MKLKKIIACLSSLALTCCAINFNSTFFPKNNSCINAYAKGEVVWEYPENGYSGTRCPVSGYYRTDSDGKSDSAVVIFPNGLVYMRNYYIGFWGDSTGAITGKVKLKKVSESYSGYYLLEFDLSEIDRPTGVDPDAWDFVRDHGFLSMDTEKAVYFNKDRKGFSVYSKFGNKLGKKSATPEYSCKLPRSYDLSNTFFRNYNAGDCFQNQYNGDYSTKYAPNAADIVMMKQFIMKCIDEDSYYNQKFNLLNADINLDGVVDTTDLSLLQQKILDPTTFNKNHDFFKQFRK